MSKKDRAGMALTLALAFCGCSAAALAAPGPETAVWKPQEAVFRYQGFTTQYSCNGLRDKVRQVLLVLGARPDLHISYYGCINGTDQLTPFPSLKIRLETLQPAQIPEAVPTAWKKVSLGGGIDKLDEGDCELAEQIRQKILPLFSVRNVRMETNCVPNQPVTGAISLKLEVLSTTVAAR